ncbi:MAG: acetyl-CoA carboxylase biotin carboxylase subunit [Bacteroidetes bacterium]|nr:acetyl-CoA carboxylase biotin carboxylase subunit [Bacteroidota bacterium]
MIKKILVANRGEIAVRVMRSCREMGIRSVAVFSEADRKSLHIRYADEAFFIGPSPSSESYLVIDKIIDAAKKSGADAIHPGYGFLSENARFSERCKQEGIKFIGPSAYSIATMGDKLTARKTIMAAGIPVVPGSKGKIDDDDSAVITAMELGLPVMIKASSGGGGKGMRLVYKKEDIVSAMRGARSEALSAFGDDTIYIEKYIASPHHIEFQILADSFGHTIHLFERECSIQRRHQKVIEETPSPVITPEIREIMGQHAVAAAKAVNYEGAGTIEFIVDDHLNYYFLEMNTRLQVEHPITERVVGVDLVKEQIRIANGEPLALKQDKLQQFGHAIECRIYAEDPDNGFMPSPGVVKHITEPLGLDVRNDSYMYEGYEIPLYYDPLISKLIVWGRTRDEAINRMKRALYSYKISGVKTTIKFLMKILDIPAFRQGVYNTHFIEDHKKEIMETERCDALCEDVAIIATYMDYISNLNKNSANRMAPVRSNWKEFGRRKGIQRS